MKLFALESGGYDRVKFQNKDLYNTITRERAKEIRDGDAEAALAYLQGKKDADEQFFYRYEVDSGGRLMRLFWADAKSIEDYKYFGDVLVFDSTYKTNDYDQPLVVLCGVNNHFSTCIFACCLVCNEVEAAFDWVLETLLEANGGKRPLSVLTDFDPAMSRSIKNILPGCVHRLCSWHLARNVHQRVSKDFRARFIHCMNSNWSRKRFESMWQKYIREEGEEGDGWVCSMYEKKEKWAMAYL